MQLAIYVKVCHHSCVCNWWEGGKIQSINTTCLERCYILIVKLHVLACNGHRQVSTAIKKGLYTGCPRKNGKNFGRVFLMLNYTDITQNTYIQSRTVTEIMPEKFENLTAVTHLLITKYILKLAGTCGFCNVNICT